MSLNLKNCLLSLTNKIPFPFYQNKDIFEYYEVIENLDIQQSKIILKAQKKSDKQQYVIKCFSKIVIAQTNEVHQLINQLYIFSITSHPNIIKVIEIFETQNELYVVMEYFESQDLYKVFNKEALSTSQKLQLIYNLLQGIKYLISKQIVHLDIKLENIFMKKNVINRQFIPIIGDFDIADIYPFKLQNDSKMKGSLGYIAPERFSMLYKYDEFEKIDIFSLGCVFFILLFKQMPFYGQNAEIAQVLNKNCEIS